MQFILSPVGWVTNDSTQAKSYATLKHGFYRNEIVTIDGKGYVFDANGELVTTPGIYTISGFQVDTEKYYVDNPEHTLAMGLRTIDNNIYFFGNDYRMVQNYFYQNNGVIYYFGTDSKMIRNTGMTINGAYYYFGSDGKALRNTDMTINGAYYYFGSDGKALRNTDMIINGKKYHFDDNGKGTLVPRYIILFQIMEAGWI